MSRLSVRLAAVVGLLAVAAGVWYYVVSRHRVTTDDAHVEGSVVIVSARVPGPVARVLVRDDWAHVAAGLLRGRASRGQGEGRPRRRWRLLTGGKR